jgi:outer membrane receptor protein involved in Fe transport
MQPNRFFRVNKINFYLSLCTIANLPFVANNAVAAEASDNTSKIETISIMSQRNLLGNEGLVNQSVVGISFAQQNDTEVRVADWLATLPGIDTSGQGGLFQSYSIRGFSRWRLRTEVDGIPIFTDRRAGNSVSFAPQALMSGLSVTKGPSSTLYGSDALGGVVSLFTSEFGSNSLGLVTETGGGNSEISATYGKDTIEHQFQSGIVRRASSRREDANGNKLDDGFSQTTGLLKYKTSINNIDIESMLLTSQGTDIGKSSRLFPNQQVTSYPDEFHNLAKVQISRRNDWLLSIYHHNQNWDTETLRVDSRENFTEYQSNTVGATGLLSFSVMQGNGRAGFDAVSRRGVDINDKEYDLAGNILADVKILEGHQNNIGFFVDQHWRFSDYSLSGGIRFDQIKQKEDTTNTSHTAKRINYSFNSEWLLTDKVVLHAEFGTGFRFPTLSELYFNGLTPRGSTIGNPDLKSERSQGGQFTLDYAFTDNLQFNLQSYYYALDNYIERFELANRDRTFRNIDKATIKGLEAAVKWQVNAHITQEIAYQKQSGKDDQAQNLADILGSRIDIKTQWQRGNWTIYNLIQHGLTQDEVGDGEGELKSYIKWSLTAAMQITDNVNLSIYGKNLLNQDTRASADEDAARLQSRNFGLKLKYQF